MAISKKLQEFLEQEKVDYEVLKHPLAYTALEIADTTHTPGRQMVKSVLLKGDGKFFLCVLPSIHLIDFEKFQRVAQVSSSELANEEEIAKLFPDFEVGAEPPFGQLYGIPVYADKLLEEDDEIVFNGGTHTEVVKMKFEDYRRLVNPTIDEIGTHI